MDEDGLDANDVVELDTFVAVVFVLIGLPLLVLAVTLLTFICSPIDVAVVVVVVVLALFSSGLVAFNVIN